jgi:DoxX-like family
MQPRMSNPVNIAPDAMPALGKSANIKMIGYWAATAFLLFNVLAGAIAELVQRQDNVEGMLFLGFPLYFMLILGVWKVLGSIALLAPGFPRLKEWAYAGIFFTMTGAAISHTVSGDAAWHMLYTGFLAILTLASWALRPQSRTLGVLFPAKKPA